MSLPAVRRNGVTTTLAPALAGAKTLCGLPTSADNWRSSEMPSTADGRSCETCLRIAQRAGLVGAEAVFIKSWHLFRVPA